jgi:hypothetical protein
MVQAIEALRDAIRHLKHNDVERNPKFRQLIYNLLLNQLVRAALPLYHIVDVAD